MGTCALSHILRLLLRRVFAAALFVFAFAVPAYAATPVFNANCSGCHAITGPRENAANAPEVIVQANTNHFMGFTVGFLNTNKATLAAEIASVIPSFSQSTSVNYQSSNNSIAIATLHVDNPSAVITSTAQSVAPASGTLTTGFSNSVSVSYSHTASDCTADSFQVIGTGPGQTTAARTVNVTINPPTNTTATGGTTSISYSTSPTSIPLTLGSSATGILITSPLSPAVGTLNVVGTSVTYTASSTQYASSLTFQYRATGPCSTQSSIVTQTINVGAPPVPSITSANSTTATGGQFFSFQVTASNIPASFAATGALPTGVTFNTSTGVLSGTPTVTGTFPLSITATNGSGTSAPQSFTLQVNFATPVVTSAGTASGTGDLPFSYQITATNLPQSFGVTGALPTGVSIDTTTGIISGTPTASGTFPVTISAINPGGTGTKALTITIAPGTPVITSPNSASGQTGQPFSYQITGTYAPASYSASALPPGVTVNSSTGLISGSPTTVGTFNATVFATNATGTGSLPVTMTITLGPPVITSANSAVGGVGNPMSYQITATQNPTSFSASGLPPGLNVNTSTGLISGTPTSGGTFNATVGATNAAGTGNLGVTFTISVLAPSITSPGTAAGQTGTATTYQITAINGPLSYGASGLPPGLAVNTSTGLISGTPTSVGTFNATVSATNGAGTGSLPVTFTITLGPPAITSPATATGAVLIAFNYQITATNSPTSFNASGLPPGVSVNTTTGLISGTPSSTGTFNATVSATNATGTGTLPVTITIGVGIAVITSANTASGQTGVTFSGYQITATNSPTSYNATGLPPGLTLNASTGLISGTPTATGTFNAQVFATNATGTGSQGVTFTIAFGPPVITSALTAGAAQTLPFAYQITASNSPTSFNATGLPAGLVVNTSTGLISGTPSTTGAFNVTISATNGTGTGSATLVITIGVGPPVITSAALVNGTMGVPLSYQVVASNGPTSYSLVSGTLPPGVTLNTATGLVSGTPSATGAFTATLGATNGAGTGTAVVTFNVALGAPAITSSLSASGTIGQPFTYNIAATNNPISYAATGLPAGLTVNTGNGVISGTPTAGGTFKVTISASNATTTVSATLTITIAFIAPTAGNLAIDVTFNTATPITLPLSGNFTQVTIVAPPANGTLSAPTGAVVTYTPKAGFFGTDTFTYSATGPGGTSTVATVTITVAGLKPIASALAMTVQINSSLTVDVSTFITGSGLTGVAVATPPAHGDVAVNGFKVTYTPQQGFFGSDSFTYVAFGNLGASDPAKITVTVIGRSDPSKDANVIGVIEAQDATVQRFARAQISNFQRRLEQLHPRTPQGDGEAAAPTLAPPRVAIDAPRAEPAPLQVAAAGGSGLTGPLPGAPTPLATAVANSFMGLAASQSMSLAANGSPGLAPGTSIWISGTVRFGHRDPVNGSTSLSFTTDGVSAGIDKAFNDRLTLGLGAGFARDKTDINSDGTKTDANGTVIAAYGSYRPAPGFFVDGVLGYGSTDIDADRFVTAAGEFARSSRKGDQWFGSLSSGYEYRHEGLLVSPYGRLDYASTRLKQASETGAGAYALTYFEQTVPMLDGSLGVLAESQHNTRFGSVRPRGRIEYTHEFENDREATIAYSDLFGTRYTVTPTGVKRNSLLLGVGSDFNFGGGLRLGLDYQARRSSHADIDQGVRLMITQDLDAKGVPQWFGTSSMFEDPVRVEAGYTWDDNVTRARDATDQLADHVFSVGASKGRVFPMGANTRVVGSLFVNAEQFYRYTGLGRVSGGFQAEFQYRPSGEFDATTFGLLGRFSGDYYDSDIRRGYQYSGAITMRRSLTDRIEAFAAITGNARYGKSAVFDQKYYGGKVNLDYSLGGPNGSLYLAGEYRRGDFASSGRFSLANIDIADVFTPDDAFGPGFFAYRIEAKGWISTVGYNRPLGPRDALDISWRRAEATPVDRPRFDVPGPFRYIDNQYSIIYLMRF